jgi:hypothetical protein
VAAGIVRIVFDDLAALDDHSDLLRADHPVRPGHLSNRVRQKQQPAARRSDLSQDIKLFRHTGILALAARSIKRAGRLAAYDRKLNRWQS